MFEVFPGDGHRICTHSGCRDTPDGITLISSMYSRTPTVFEVFPGDGYCICTHSGCRDTPDGILDLVSILLRPSPGVHCTAVYATLAIRYICTLWLLYIRPLMYNS